MTLRLLATLAIGILVGILASCTVRQPEAQAQPEKPQRWEYKEVSVDFSGGHDKVLKDLNAAGDEGWELALTWGGVGILKRPKR